MDKKTILDYVDQSPQNSNRNVLSGMLDSFSEGGGEPGEPTKPEMGTLIVYNNSSNLRGEVLAIPSYDEQTNRLMLYGLSPMNPGESYTCKTALDIYGGIFTTFETQVRPSNIRGIDGTSIFIYKMTNDNGDFVSSSVHVFSDGVVAKVEFFDN